MCHFESNCHFKLMFQLMFLEPSIFSVIRLQYSCGYWIGMWNLTIKFEIHLSKRFQPHLKNVFKSPVSNLCWEGSYETCGKHHQRHSSNHRGVLRWIFFISWLKYFFMIVCSFSYLYVCMYYLHYHICKVFSLKCRKVAILYFQLSRHCLQMLQRTHSKRLATFKKFDSFHTFKEWSQRLVTFKTFDSLPQLWGYPGYRMVCRTERCWGTTE